LLGSFDRLSASIGRTNPRSDAMRARWLSQHEM
jgi:hypothetical protein